MALTLIDWNVNKYWEVSWFEVKTRLRRRLDIGLWQEYWPVVLYSSIQFSFSFDFIKIWKKKKKKKALCEYTHGKNGEFGKFLAKKCCYLEKDCWNWKESEPFWTQKQKCEKFGSLLPGKIQYSVLHVDLPASRKTLLKSNGQSLRKPSSDPVTQKDSLMNMALIAIPAPENYNNKNEKYKV